MVLLYFEKDGTTKAATIRKPNIIPQVTEVLGKMYKPEVAERYAKKVADFFVTKMIFPENGIYRLNGEGKLCRFNLKEKEWNQNGDEKNKYFINESSDFWKEFDKEFPYLLNSRKELISMVEEQTKNMFEISPDICRSIMVDGNQFYTDKGGSYALKDVFLEYCTEETTQTIISELLMKVFGAKSMPLFVIIDNIPQIALTESSVVTDKNEEAINEFLSKYFSKEDVVKISVKVKNSIFFGADAEYQIVNVAKLDKYDVKRDVKYIVTCIVAGLYVKLTKYRFGRNTMELVENETNKETLKSFKVLKKGRWITFYEAYEQGRKILIRHCNDKYNKIEVDYEPFEELSEEPD